MTTPKAKFAGLALITALCAGFTLGLTAPGWAGFLAGLALIAALCAGVTLGLTAPAWGGFKEGEAAYKRGDYATALREWRSLAEQGNAKAQFFLGLMYSKGRGVPQDYAEAVGWWHKAAEQGVAEAQYNLGVMYDRGLGVTQDYA